VAQQRQVRTIIALPLLDPNHHSYQSTRTHSLRDALCDERSTIPEALPVEHDQERAASRSARLDDTIVRNMFIEERQFVARWHLEQGEPVREIRALDRWGFLAAPLNPREEHVHGCH
jgi:hypothetical protein